MRWSWRRGAGTLCGVAGDLTIRRSRAEDFEPWFALFEEVAAEDRWIGREAPVDRESARQRFDHNVDSVESTTFLAEADGLLVGLLGVTLAGGCAELGMMVRASHRGQRVGSALMDASLAWCRANDAYKVTLTVWPHNTRAIALYEKYGFVAEGRLVRHVRRRNGELWDAIPMGLVLDSLSPGSGPDDAG
jgi:RimJ/RimL family protein N-acetyltransferase